jgi:hypothetical protein
MALLADVMRKGSTRGLLTAQTANLRLQSSFCINLARRVQAIVARDLTARKFLALCVVRRFFCYPLFSIFRIVHPTRIVTTAGD